MILRRTIRLLAVAALATACSGCELIIDLFTGQHATKTVSGTVTVNGEPYYPAVLYVSSRDSTFTDQRGVYSLLIEQYVPRLWIRSIDGVTFREDTVGLIQADQTVDFEGYTAARVFGRVSTAAGPVAGATLRITSNEIGSRTTTSGQDGEYEFTGLPPTFATGNLELSVTSSPVDAEFPVAQLAVFGADVEHDVIGVMSSTNMSPVATILAPLDGDTYPVDEPISFAGSAVDAEDGALTGNALSWTSSLDGAIGTGLNFSRTLSAGAHTITLTATDSENATGTATVAIAVTEATTGTGIIQGYVTGNGNGVGGATVTVAGPVTRTAVTIPSGGFLFLDLPVGTYTVSVSTSLNIDFPQNPQTVTLAAGQEVVVNFEGTY